MNTRDPDNLASFTALHYIGGTLEGFTNLPATCCPVESGSGGGVIGADVDLGLGHLAAKDCGTWRFPEELVREWKQHADEALAQATEALGGDALVPPYDPMQECGFVEVSELRHLGIFVNFKTRTLLRRGSDQHATLKDGQYWKTFQTILVAGRRGIEASGMQKRYGANDPCRSAIVYLRKKLMPLHLYISDRKYALVDLDEYLRQSQVEM